MTVDIRARCTCSAGELISASISDSYRADAGILFQRGSCVVKGINAVAVGTPVTFSYQGVQRGGRIQRRLLVLGSSVNGLEGTTNLELGCDFTLYQNFSENKVYTTADGVGDPDLDDEDAAIVTVPLLANEIAKAILTKLGLSGNPDLSNKFSVAEFDLSGGYVSTLGSLLQSECKLAYIMPEGVVAFIDALQSSGSATTLTDTSIIELQPLSIGEPPAAVTTVSYSSLKLKAPEDADAETLNWEKEETYGVPTTVQVENPFWAEGPPGIPTGPRPQYFRYTYTPHTLIERTYDTLDRLTKQVTTEYTILAEIAPGYVQHISGRYFRQTSSYGTVGGGLSGVTTTNFQTTPPQGASVYTIITTETTTYKVPAPRPSQQVVADPEGYEQVEKVETIVSEPVLKLVGSTQIYGAAGDLNIEFDYGLSNTVRFIAEKQISRSEQALGPQRQQVTKATTERYLCQAYTQVGQQALAEAISKNGGNTDFFPTPANAMFVGAQSLKCLGVETRIASGREVGLQRRPPQAGRTLAAWADGGDPNNGWQTESSSQSEQINGTGFGTQTFSLPYAPDDVFIKAGTGYAAIKSDAAAKARAYGTVQNKIRAGMRHGVNVKTAAWALQGTIGGLAAVSVNGVSVAGLAEGISYTLDSSGVVASVDVVPLGTIGGSGGGGGGGGGGSLSWIPTPTGVSTLPAAPVVTDTTPTAWIGFIETVGATPQTALDAAFPDAVSGDGVQDTTTWNVWVYNGSTWVNVGSEPGPTVTVGTLVPMFNERVTLVARTSTKLEVTSLPYALSLLTQVAVTTRTALAVTRILKVEVPAAGVSVAGVAPAVSIGVALRPPAANVAVAGAVPAVSTATVVQVPAAAVAVAGATPTVEASLTVVLVPAANVTVAGATPDLQAGDDYYTNLATQFFTLLRDWRVDWWGD